MWSLPTAPKQKAACLLFWNPIPKAAVILGKCAFNYRPKDYKRRGGKMSAWFISSPRIHSVDPSRKTLHLPSQARIAKGLYPDLINPLRGQATDWSSLILLTPVAAVSHTEKTFCGSWAEWLRMEVCAAFMCDCKTEPSDKANLLLTLCDLDPAPPKTDRKHKFMHFLHTHGRRARRLRTDESWWGWAD